LIRHPPIIALVVAQRQALLTEKLWGGVGDIAMTLLQPMELAMAKVDDLSRCLTPLDQNSTLMCVVELSRSSWLVAGMVPGVERQPLKKIEPDASALMRVIERWCGEAIKANRAIGRMVLAYEAGRDGFWLSRWLRSRSVEAHVIHSTSVAISREHRRAKTDRLDTAMLMRVFVGWLRGERGHCSMVAVPTIEEEDAKRPGRERETLIGERTRIINRMKAALARLGVHGFKPELRNASARLETLGWVQDGKLKDISLTEFDFSDSIGHFSLKNLMVASLRISLCEDFSLENCWIGTLYLQGSSARLFEVRGGGILNIQSPPPTAENPFTGSVHFDKHVYLPRRSNDWLKGPQSYRNMRSHMLKLENNPMVTRFHRLEQLLERETADPFDNLISWVYSGLSGFGSSTLKPVLCFAALLVLTFLFALWGGVAAAHPDDLVGWQRALIDHYAWGASLRRAVTLTAQSTINPVGVFGTRAAVYAQNGWLASWLVLHGLLSAILVALFAIAVRRRFKIS
jgi:hypothetical protein